MSSLVGRDIEMDAACCHQVVALLWCDLECCQTVRVIKVDAQQEAMD